MKKSKFNELIEKAQKNQTEKYGFWGAIGSLSYSLRVQNLTINADQFDRIIEAIIKEKF